MKQIINLLAVFVFLTTNLVYAQTADEKAVATAVEQLKTAMLDGNKQQLEQITANDLSYGHSSGKIENKAQFVGTLTSGVSDFLTMDLTEQTIKVVGNTAIVRHKLAGKTNDNGTAATVNLGVMLVFQKQQQQWKLLARQAFKL